MSKLIFWMFYVLSMLALLTWLMPARAGETSVGLGYGAAHTDGPNITVRHVFGERKASPYIEAGYIDDDVFTLDGGVHIQWNRRLYSVLGGGVHSDNDLIADYAHYHIVALGLNINERVSIEWGHRSNCSNFMPATGSRCLGLTPRGNQPNLGIDMIQLRVDF
jgi:hypothetical protein